MDLRGVYSGVMQFHGNLVLHDPVGEKWERKKKSGKHPTFAIPSPVQPPLRLMFDISMFSYQNEEKKNRQIIIERQRINQYIQSLDIYSKPSN